MSLLQSLSLSPPEHEEPFPSFEAAGREAESQERAIMIIVDRNSFIAYSEGILMDFHEGKGVVGDSLKNEEAEAAMERGETIGLMVGGELVTTMKLEDGGFVETLIGNEGV